ncbi:MAG: hypothetical protein LBK25_06125 [Treponema sp.]|nr:hypothetical protein [Treponema sp.]
MEDGKQVTAGREVAEQDIPNIRRARGYRLYTENGERLVDLWQAGGGAVLGHTPHNLVRELKNTAERGLFAPYPASAERRFVKALSALFRDGEGFYVFSDRSRLHAALEDAGILKKNDPIPDSAFLSPPETTAASITLWRPFCVCPPSPLLVPVLPWSLAPAVLVVKESGRTMVKNPLFSDTIASVILAAATRAIYDLIAEINAADRKRSFPKITKTLAMKGCLWKQNGVYLRTDVDDTAYERLFHLFLDAGFLLPPAPRSPAILPSELSEGEEASLVHLLSPDRHACLNTSHGAL